MSVKAWYKLINRQKNKDFLELLLCQSTEQMKKKTDTHNYLKTVKGFIEILVALFALLTATKQKQFNDFPSWPKHLRFKA